MQHPAICRVRILTQKSESSPCFAKLPEKQVRHSADEGDGRCAEQASATVPVAALEAAGRGWTWACLALRPGSGSVMIRQAPVGSVRRRLYHRRLPLRGGKTLSEQITQLLHRWQQGDLQAREHLFEALYADLMLIARNRLVNHTGGTLQPAVLVNESLLRLLGTDVDYNDRTHFIAVAALKMRSVLVDHLRARAADKRGGNAEQLTLSRAENAVYAEGIGYGVLALHQAWTRLSELEPRAASSIELTYFGGMSRDEIALVLGISAPTVDRDLRFARAWLNRQLL